MSKTLQETYSFTLEGRVDKSTFSEICKKIFETAYEKFSCIDAVVKFQNKKILLIINHLNGHRRIRLCERGNTFEYPLSQKGLRAERVSEGHYKIDV